MHYLDSNTDLTQGVDLFLNTRVDSSNLVDAEITDENSGDIVRSTRFDSLELVEGAYFQSVRLTFLHERAAISILLEDEKTYSLVLKKGGINVYQNYLYVDKTKAITTVTTKLTAGQILIHRNKKGYVIVTQLFVIK